MLTKINLFQKIIVWINLYGFEAINFNDLIKTFY